MSIIYEALKRVEGQPCYRRERKINSKKIILPLLIAISGIILIYSLTNLDSIQNSGRKTTLNTKQASSTRKTSLKRTYRPLLKKPQAFMFRDPFSQTSKFRLSGIIYSPSESIAIVNSKTVSIGEKVGNAKVAKINKESVELSLDGKKIILTLD